MKKDLRKITTLPTVVDIGSDAIRVLVADVLADGSLSLRGVGEATATGIVEGKIVDIQKAGESLKKAIKEAELMSAQKVNGVLVAMADEYVYGMLNMGVAAISDDKVSLEDVKTVHRVAVAGIADKSLSVLAAVEHDYEIDNRPGIRQPLGMTGRKLTGNIHLVVAQRQSLENMERCLNYSGVISLGNFIFSGLAAAAAVLTADEKELGVCLVDIGAGTTKVVLYADGVLCETLVIPIASDDIHRDIAHVHHASLQAAKNMKRNVGLQGESDEFVRLPDAGGGEDIQVSKTVLHDTIGFRVDEILDNVGDIIKRFVEQGGNKLSAGIVFVGDGALLPGLATVAKEKLHVGVRVGTIRYRGENYERVSSPRFAVGMGLLMDAAVMRMEEVRVPLGTRLFNFIKQS